MGHVYASRDTGLCCCQHSVLCILPSDGGGPMQQRNANCPIHPSGCSNMQTTTLPTPASCQATWAPTSPTTLSSTPTRTYPHHATPSPIPTLPPDLQTRLNRCLHGVPPLEYRADSSAQPSQPSGVGHVFQFNPDAPLLHWSTNPSCTSSRRNRTSNKY